MSNPKLLILKTFSLIIFSLILAIPGCIQPQEGDEDMNNRGKGKVFIKITDAPFPAEMVAEANITVDRITLIKRIAEDIDEGAEGEDAEAEAEDSLTSIELEEPVTFNLLELSNGTTALLAEMEASTGVYPEIRLHVTGAGIVLKDGNTFGLKVPGGDASGLKIKMNPSLELEEGEVVEVLLDFDVSRSFVMRGNVKHGVEKINGFIFKPVVRAVAHVLETTGEVSGMVTDEKEEPVRDALVSLVSGEDTITSAITTEEGFFAMIGIPAGNYLLACEKEGYNKQQIEILVEKRKVTEQNFVLEESDESSGGDGN